MDNYVNILNINVIKYEIIILQDILCNYVFLFLRVRKGHGLLVWLWIMRFDSYQKFSKTFNKFLAYPFSLVL